MVEDTRREAMEEEELKESYWAKLAGQPDQERTQDLNPMEIQKYFLDDEDPIEAEESIKPADPEEEGITVVMTKGGKISIPSFSFSKKT